MQLDSAPLVETSAQQTGSSTDDAISLQQSFLQTPNASHPLQQSCGSYLRARAENSGFEEGTDAPQVAQPDASDLLLLAYPAVSIRPTDVM
jgi:hypothetical protein